MPFNAAFLDWEVDVLQWLSQNRHPVLDMIIGFLNFTGDILFFTIILPLIYWAASKRIGFQLGIVLFSSFYLNVLLKDTFHIARPFQAHGDRIVPLAEIGGSSFPSGHSQHSASTWGFIAGTLRRTWVYIAAAAMIAAVGFARLYSGVHYPKDVITGWSIGLVIAFTVILLRNKLSRLYISNTILLGLAVIIPFVLLPVYHLLTVGDLDVEGAYQACGLLTFTIVGFVWERSAIRFVIPASWTKKLLAITIGLAGLLVIKEGIKLITPDHFAVDFFRYGLMGLWTIAIAPWLFTLLKLYPTVSREAVQVKHNE